MSYLVYRKDKDEVTTHLESVSRSIDWLKQKLEDTRQDFDGLVTKTRSEISNLLGRLNSGDIKKEMITTAYNLNNLVVQFDYLKSYIYNEQQYAILPAKSAKFPNSPTSPVSPSFDITSSEGREQLKSYLKLKSPVRYNDVKKYGPTNQKFKRVFVPRRGWIAMKKFEEEAAEYGGNSFIKM